MFTTASDATSGHSANVILVLAKSSFEYAQGYGRPSISIHQHERVSRIAKRTVAGVSETAQAQTRARVRQTPIATARQSAGGRSPRERSHRSRGSFGTRDRALPPDRVARTITPHCHWRAPDVCQLVQTALIPTHRAHHDLPDRACRPSSTSRLRRVERTTRRTNRRAASTTTPAPRPVASSIACNHAWSRATEPDPCR